MSNLPNEQLENLLALADAATPGTRLLTTVNQNPRGLAWYKQVVRVTDSGQLGGVPAPKTLMELQFTIGDTRTVEAADGDIMYHNPGPQTKADAAFIAAAAHPGTVRLLVQELLQHRAAHATAATGAAAEIPQQYQLSIRAMRALFADWGLADCNAALDHLLKHYAALTTPTPAQTPPPAAARCGGWGWIAVGERLPDSAMLGGSKMVLCLLWNNNYSVGYYNYRSGEWREYDDAPPIRVTHWQPLPTPPKSCTTCPAAAAEE